MQSCLKLFKIVKRWLVFPEIQSFNYVTVLCFSVKVDPLKNFDFKYSYHFFPIFKKLSDNFPPKFWEKNILFHLNVAVKQWGNQVVLSLGKEHWLEGGIDIKLDRLRTLIITFTLVLGYFVRNCGLLETMVSETWFPNGFFIVRRKILKLLFSLFKIFASMYLCRELQLIQILGFCFNAFTNRKLTEKGNYVFWLLPRFKNGKSWHF